MRPIGSLFHYRPVRFILVLTVFVVLSWRVDRSVLTGYFVGLDARFLAAMFGVNGILLLICSWRWFLIATAAGVHAPLGDFVKATWLGWAVAECGPSLVVGEWARFRLMRMYADPLQLVLGQFVDRLSAYAGLLLLALCSVAWTFGSGGGAGGARAVAELAAVCAAGLLMINALLRRFRAALDRDAGSIERLQHLLFRSGHYALSLLTNTLFAANFALAALALGYTKIGWGVFCLAPLVLLGTGSLPSLVSDWGKREAAATLVLAQIGLDTEQSLAVSIVYGGMNLISALPGFLVPILGAEPGALKANHHEPIDSSAPSTTDLSGGLDNPTCPTRHSSIHLTDPGPHRR